MFAELIGNETAKQTLTRMIEKGAIGNSLLFAGPAGIGKMAFAASFAKGLIGQSPDLHIYRPEGKVGLHSIESMRSFCREVYLAPFAAPWKIFIIQDADRMLPTSANALLKTFEEPAPQSLIILISAHPEQLLPTVVSRCRTLYFQPLSDEQVSLFLQRQMPKEQADAIAPLAQGSLSTACQLLEESSAVLRKSLIESLKLGRFADYAQLSQACKAFADRMETSQDQVKDEIYSGSLEDLSAAQKSGIAKEVEGIIRIRQSDLVQQFFQQLLFWYRDLALLQLGGDPSLLFHKDQQEALEQQVEKGNILPLDQVTKAVQEAKLAFDRSGTLALCLENLFLKLL
jgi:DNA polymerase III subunit delta'